jgi:hypothetical protein
MFTRSPSDQQCKTSAPVQQWLQESVTRDPLDWASVFVGAERACCCSARPVVVAVFPARAGRPHPVDLLLCGHHYRACRTGLEAAGAVLHCLPRS